MSRPALLPHDVDALVFDVIGTLVDEEPTWARAAGRLAAETGAADPADLLVRWVAGLEQRMSAVVAGESPWESHRRLVENAARDAITGAGGTPSAEALARVSTIDDDYPAWPDVAAATAALRRGRLVVGVSNGDPDSLTRLANANAISWDIALSTGGAQTFKPAPAAYRYAIDALRLDPARTLFVAAHPWDLRAAAGHGFRTAYAARPGAERPAPDDEFDLAVDDLSALVALLAGG